MKRAMMVLLSVMCAACARVTAASADVAAAPPTPVLAQATTSSSPVAAAPAQVSAASAAIASMAQNVANQMGCGLVQDNGNATYIAPCGSYGVLIDCDGSQCRPMHTVKTKSKE